nr:type 1 glutamine amidotransferase [Leucobacter chinensis]
MTGWLEAMGIVLVEHHGADGLPETLAGFHGVVLLGGGLMPNDYEKAPWLHTERALTREAIDDDVPTLGICLGAQIIADVAGGEVRASYGPKERGSTPIHATELGAADAVIAAIGETSPMIENHEDMITVLPEGARLLASSDAVENQAFVIGQHVRGVQFHPEASAESLRLWNEAALTEQGYDVQAMLDAADAHHEANTAASKRLIEAFGREVLARAEAHAEGAQ